MKFLKRLVVNEKGVSAIEAALGLPFLLLAFCAIAQLGLISSTYAGMNHALDRAGRLAVIYPTPGDTEIRNAAMDAAFALRPSQIQSLTITRGKANGRDYADLEFLYEVEILFPLVPQDKFTLKSERRAYASE